MIHIMQNDATILRLSETTNPFSQPPRYYFTINLRNKKLAVADRMIFDESMWCVDIRYILWMLFGLGMGCLFAFMYTGGRITNVFVMMLIIIATGFGGVFLAGLSAKDKTITKLYLDKQRGDIYIDWYDSYGHHSDCRLSCEDFDGFMTDLGETGSTASSLSICFKSLGCLLLTSDTDSSQLQALENEIKTAIEDATH